MGLLNFTAVWYILGYTISVAAVFMPTSAYSKQNCMLSFVCLSRNQIIDTGQMSCIQGLP